jgi:hypothetical protein
MAQRGALDTRVFHMILDVNACLSYEQARTIC